MPIRIPLLLFAALLVQPAPPERPTAFWNVSVIDVAAGTERAGMVVEVANGRITRVARASGARPANALIVDGAGRFLIPGLWDSHVHLTKLGASSLPVFIANGVTSVRDMGSDLAEVLRWRREIESGTRVGPRIRTPGQILESAANVERMKREGTVEPVDRIRLPVGSPEEARTAVNRLADSGADFLKIRTVKDEATLRAVAAAARARGLQLTGHPVASPDVLFEIGIGSVEHVLTFPPLDIPLRERRALFERMRAAGVRMGTTTVNLEGSVLVPYDSALARLKADPLGRYVGEYLASDWTEQVEEKKGPEAARALEDFARALPNVYRDLREMHAAGVEFLAGSDAAVVFMHPGFSLHGELDSLVHHVGLTTAAALRAATIGPARFFGLERELGAVSTGYRADLVLLEGNPLDDIRATRRIAGVMHDGHWRDRHDLDALLEAAASEARGLKPPPAFRANVDVLTIDVQVVAAQDKPADGLSAEQFDVSIAGRSRRVVRADFLHLDEGRATRDARPATTDSVTLAACVFGFERSSTGANGHYLLAIESGGTDTSVRKGVRVRLADKTFAVRRWAWRFRAPTRG